MRGEMEGRFGHEFSSVRVHTDARAGATAGDINAAAFTVGQDIVFGPGRYAPATLEGSRLLAHELAHTIQQRGAEGKTGPPIAPGSSLEGQASVAGRTAAAGGTVEAGSLGSSAVAVARQVDDDLDWVAEELTASEREEFLRHRKSRIADERFAQLIGYARRRAESRAASRAAAGGRASSAAPTSDDEDEVAPTSMALPEPGAKKSRSKHPPARPVPARRHEPAAKERFLPGGFTDDEIARVVAESEDEVSRAIQAEEDLETEFAYRALVPLRDERLIRSLDRKTKVEKALRLLPMRSRQILRHYGLDEPSSYSRILSLHSDLRRAIDRAMSDRRGGASFVTEPDVEAEEREKLVEPQGEALASMTESPFGAYGGGVTQWATDDPKKIAGGAGLGGGVFSVVGSRAAAVPGSYSPPVENPFADRYGAWRYSRPPSLEPPPRAIVEKAPPRLPMPTPDVPVAARVATPAAYAKTAPSAAYAKTAPPEALAPIRPAAPPPLRVPAAFEKTLPDPKAKTVPAEPAARPGRQTLLGAGVPPAPRAPAIRARGGGGPEEVTPDQVRALYGVNPAAVKKNWGKRAHQEVWVMWGGDPKVAAPLAFRKGRVIKVDELLWPTVGKLSEINQPHELVDLRARSVLDPHAATVPAPREQPAAGAPPARRPGRQTQVGVPPGPSAPPRRAPGGGVPEEVTPDEVRALYRVNPMAVKKNWGKEAHQEVWVMWGGDPKVAAPLAFRKGRVIKRR